MQKVKNLQINIEQLETKTLAVLTAKVYFENEFEKFIFQQFNNAQIKIYKDHALFVLNSETNLCEGDVFDSEKGKKLIEMKIKLKLYKLLIEINIFYIEYLNNITGPQKIQNIEKFYRCYERTLDYYNKLKDGN